MAEGFDRRDVIQDRLAPTGQSKQQDRVPLSPVQAPRPTSQNAAGSGMANLSNILGAANGILGQYIQKKTNEAVLEGEMAYAEGVTEQEILAQGNKHTTAGFMTMKMRTAGNEWMQNELDEIKSSSHQMSPQEYRQKLSQGFKELTAEAGDDPMLNELMAGMARDMMPKLVTQQTAQHNAWNKENTIQSYTDLLVSETGTDQETLLELADPNNSPLGIDDHREVLSNALSIQLESGTTTLYDALTPADETVQDFMRRGFNEKEATGLANSVSRHKVQQSQAFTAKRTGIEKTILAGVNGNEAKSVDEIMDAKEQNNFSDDWANRMLNNVRSENAKYIKEEKTIQKVTQAVLDGEGYLLTGDDHKKAVTAIAQMASIEAQAAAAGVPESEQLDFTAKESRRIFHTKLAENAMVDTETRKDMNNAASAETLLDKDGGVSDDAMNAFEDYALIKQIGGDRLASEYLEEGSYMSDLLPLVMEMSEGSNSSLETAIQVAAAQLSTAAPDERLAPFNGDYEKRNKAIRKRVDEAMRPGTLFGRVATGNIYHGSTDEERKAAMNDPRVLNEISRQCDLAMSNLAGSTMSQSAKDKVALNRAMNNVMRRTSFVDGQALMNPPDQPTVEELAGLNGDTTALTRGVKALFSDVAPVMYAGRDYELGSSTDPKMDIQYHAESGNLIIRPYNDVATGTLDTIFPFLRPDDIIDDPIVMNVRDVGEYIRAKDLGIQERMDAVLEKYQPVIPPKVQTNPNGTNTIIPADQLIVGAAASSAIKDGSGDDFIDGVQPDGSLGVTVTPKPYTGEDGSTVTPELTEYISSRNTKPTIAHKDVLSSNEYYSGEDAVAKVTEIEGALTPAQEVVVQLEGYVDAPYWDSSNEGKRELTVGVGQTKEWMDRTFKESFKDHEDKTKGFIKDYDNLPEYLQAELIQATYRGDLGFSERTRKLINSGEFSAAAQEFLDNDDYRASLQAGDGTASRMERVSDALTRYSKNQ